MTEFLHRVRAATVWLPALAIAVLASGCDENLSPGGLAVGLSPQAGVIAPCSPTRADAWSFVVTAGDEVMLSVDTSDGATAADFELRGICGTSDFFFADDNFLCTFPPPAFSCPATVFTATADADCVVDVSPALTGVSPPMAACSDATRADYDLFVDVAGNPAWLTQIRRSTNRVCVGGSNNSRSCSSDTDCPGGSCERATSLRASLKIAESAQSPIAASP